MIGYNSSLQVAIKQASDAGVSLKLEMPDAEICLSILPVRTRETKNDEY